MIRSKYALSDTGHIEAAGRPAGRPSAKVRILEKWRFTPWLRKKLGFFENWKKCHKKPDLLGEIVSKMKKIYTTFFALLALRSNTNYVSCFDDGNPFANTKIWRIFFVRSSPLVNFGNVHRWLLRLRATLRSRSGPNPHLVYERSEAG